MNKHANESQLKLFILWSQFIIQILVYNENQINKDLVVWPFHRIVGWHLINLNWKQYTLKAYTLN